jgi:hypothetical protein
MMYFASFFVSSVIVYVKCFDDGAATHDATTERFQAATRAIVKSTKQNQKLVKRKKC